jgi:predicted Rossmann-fold nucleotide-binding protein
MGSDYWKQLDKFIEKELYSEHKAIDKNDMKLYTITDDIEEALTIIRKAPIRRQN